MNANWLKDEGFHALSALQLLNDPRAVRDTMGVYMIFMLDADQILSRAGLSETSVLIPWTIFGHQHVYTGEGTAMRSRALLHLCGTIRDSSVREFLLSLQFAKGVLWSASNETLFAMERRLTKWLIENTYIAFRAGGYVGDAEKELIRRMPSPFNIAHNSKSHFLPALKAERQKFRDHLEATRQRHYRMHMPPSAWLLRANHLAGLASSQSTKPLS